MFNNQTSSFALIVDDNPCSHEIMEDFLTDAGLLCHHAFGCIEAVELCDKYGSDYYSLILMDINMPKINGIEIARILTSAGVASPIIAVTAFSSNDSAVAIPADLFKSTVRKPFSYSDFYRAVLPYISSTFCDCKRGIRNAGGNKRIFAKHANNFKAANADLYLRLTKLLLSNEYSQAAFLCHSIKGLSGMLGFTSLYTHIITLEDLMHSAESGNINTTEISISMALIDNDMQNICKIQF